MKASRYNFILESDEKGYLIYNGLSGGFAKISCKEYEIYKKIIDGEQLDDQKKLIKEFRKGFFVLPDEFDELGYLRVMANIRRFQTNNLSLTIAPTLDCNFACIYCFEEKSKVYMDKKVEKETLNFIEKRLPTVNSLSISWYGGEPLLAMNTIENISKNLISKSEELGFKYRGYIVTNRYLLTKKVAEKLRDLAVYGAQITIDGPRNIHNKRRPLRNGKGTFDTIFENFMASVDILDNIAIRVNIDKTNRKYIPKLIDFFKDSGLEKIASIYFSPVRRLTQVCESAVGCYEERKEFSKEEVELYKYLDEKGFKISIFPKPLYGFCGAIQLNSFLIGPEGNLYKCWNTIGMKDKMIGNVSEGITYPHRFIDWMKWDQFAGKECLKCKVLPICMGGCPYTGMTTGVECESWKYNLLEMLKLYYKNKTRTSPNGREENVD